MTSFPTFTSSSSSSSSLSLCLRSRGPITWTPSLTEQKPRGKCHLRVSHIQAVAQKACLDQGLTYGSKYQNMENKYRRQPYSDFFLQKNPPLIPCMAEKQSRAPPAALVPSYSSICATDLYQQLLVPFSMKFPFMNEVFHGIPINSNAP